MHSYHPDLGPPSCILFDGCDECERLSKMGLAGVLELGMINASALWRRMLVTEKRGDFPDPTYRSNAEARLGRELYHLAVLLHRAGNQEAWGENLIRPVVAGVA